MRIIKYVSLVLIFALFLQAGFAASLNTGNRSSNRFSLADTTNSGKLILGKYNIYSGIPSMYIGHFELKEGGNYMVALSSDEDSYATGTYTYNSAANTIEWKTGFFWQKKWGGKITNTSGNTAHIEFTHITYADNNK